MQNKNLIIISTYVASGVTDINFLNQRIKILELSTIPSIMQQTCKNFIWCIYLDEMNNPFGKLKSMINTISKYGGKIRLLIMKYKPILKDGSLCLHNRARSCSAKRFELYLKTLDFCEKKGYLNNIEYISHMMLDDDDPILNTHMDWINQKVEIFKDKLNDNKGVIVMNNNQYIFYLHHTELKKIKSTKALKGSCFIFYPIKIARTIAFHPYSILERMENNHVYKDKYNINSVIVSDEPTWIYFRHNLSTSGYSKQYIIEDDVNTWHDNAKILNIMNFYTSENLENLKSMINVEIKSMDIINWKNYRTFDKKKIMFIISDINEYKNIISLPIFLKNTFITYTILLDDNGINNKLIMEHKYFYKHSYCQSLTCKKGVNKGIANKILEFAADFIIILGNPKKLIHLRYYLRKKLFFFEILNSQDKCHLFLNTRFKHFKDWNDKDRLIIYKLLLKYLLVT